MPRKSITEKEELAQAAAYLSAQYHLKQDDIAPLLGGVTQSYVSKLLKQAEKSGWLDVKYSFIGFDRLPAERQQYLRQLAEPRDLLDRLREIDSDTGVRVRRVGVFNSGGEGASRHALERRLWKFGRAVVAEVIGVIDRSSICALTWGSTLSHLVAALETAAPRLSRRPPMFVPVCAAPTDQTSNQDTSSQLVRRLHQLFDPEGRAPLSLTGVSALIPRRYAGAQAAGIRRFVEEAASYAEIFGRPKPLIDRVDALITSAGPARRPMGFIHEELLRAGSLPGARLTSAKLRDLVSGDIAGVLVPRADLDAVGRREVELLNLMWTGVKMAHLERLARQSEKTRQPGVVVATIGRNRAEVILAGVRRGIVNELIIDRDLAAELSRVLDQQRPAMPVTPRPRGQGRAGSMRRQG